jgi:uncharacterized protein
MRFALTPKACIAGALIALAMAAPVRADEPSAEGIALAASVLDDVGLNNSVAAIVPLTLRDLERNIAAIHPEMQSALTEASVAILPEFAKSGEKVLGDLAHVFAARMTEPELRDTKAFFESPVGKKYLESQPVILQEFSVATSVWRRQLSTDLLARLREEMKKKGYDF